MMRRVLITLFVLGAVTVAAPTAAQAAAPQPMRQFAASCGNGVASLLFFKSWDACLQHDSNGSPKITKLSDLWLILLPLLEDAIKAAGYTAAGFVIWGGVKYIKSQGDSGQVNESRQTIYNALFGLLLALLSVAIVNFVAGAIK